MVVHNFASNLFIHIILGRMLKWPVIFGLPSPVFCPNGFRLVAIKRTTIIYQKEKSL
jgi:hypothetical protein